MTTRPNIIWITLDSVRADHTSMHGYGRDTTPNLARIADDSEATYFRNAFAGGIATSNSTGTILTGTYPLTHGLTFRNGVVPDQLATAPELFANEGYRTACLSRNSYLSAGTGLNRGFDCFEWLAADTLLDVVDLKSLFGYLRNARRHSAGFTTDTSKHATPFLMNEVAKRWLDDLSDDEPFFCYLHYNEPHRPYYPPLPYLDHYTDDLDMSAAEAADISMRVHENLLEIVANGNELTEAEERALVAMYDAEIAYTDEMVGRLFDYVQSLGLDDTVVVVTADHGELFGEQGLLAHQIVLDDALLNVPLVTHGFDSLEADEDDLVQHHDVMQTLLAKVGANTDQFQGVDLRKDTRTYAIAQHGANDFDPYLRHNPDFNTSRYHSAALTAFRDHEFKYQESDDGADLFALPDEETDVSDDYPEVTARLRKDLRSWLESHGQPIESDAESELTESMQRQLRDLGYLE